MKKAIGILQIVSGAALLAAGVLTIVEGSCLLYTSDAADEL